MKNFGIAMTALFFAIVAGGCGDDDDKSKLNEECDLEASDCDGALVCEETQGGGTQCAFPVVIRGTVVDSIDESAVEGSIVQAVDPNASAVGTSDISDEGGAFSLTVPAMRDADGAPVETAYTLRVQASGYDKFPSGIRMALPIDAASAVKEGEGWVIESALTTVLLLPLKGDAGTLGAISGEVGGEDCDGVLLVADSGVDARVGYSDADCHYTIFNVPAGDYTVSGYAAEVQLASVPASVTAGGETTGVNLAPSDAPLATVSGNVQIVNAPGGLTTSVVLAVESTFLETIAIGEVPPGLRVGDVSGDFTIQGVPRGRYVVLAAFENDGLVRDPDESIGGTQIVHIEVPGPDGDDIDITEGFKVTEALAVIRPGAEGPESVTTQTPSLEWADDSSEDGYTIWVYDAFGEEIWTDEIAGVSGSSTVADAYAGPALEPGMFYQFRVTSFRNTNDGRVSISRTEDLRGVFQYTP